MALEKYVMNKICLSLTWHSHQPLGNFENVLEEAFQKSYQPFLQTAESFPFLKINLHFSGILWEWLETRHPEYLEQLHRLITLNRIEMMGGGYYEPILPILPEVDARAQITRLSQRLEGLFRVKPRGAWLAERVWEQPLAGLLCDAGIDYVILDENHFLMSGLQPEELHGYFITEDKGKRLWVIPGSKQLRYTIPFADPWVTIEYLRKIAGRQENALVVMADDCEKMGAWPKTYKHVYEDRWLARFLEELERNQDWIETVRISDYLDRFAPIQKVYLPNASYPEMMEWALPVWGRNVQSRCTSLLKQQPNADELLSFVRGGYWRNFLVKYPEADFLHKKMWAVSSRVHQIENESSLNKEKLICFHKAQRDLLKSQCNDAYWHGVFGGIYSPHLRTALLASLIEANVCMDQIEERCGSNAEVEVTQIDFDCDGKDEVLLRSRGADLYFQPGDGGTIREIDFKPSAVPLINSLRRQPEFYHQLLGWPAGSNENPELRHDRERLTAAERELDQFLRYDRYSRHSYRLLLFPEWKSLEDYDRQNLEADHVLAAGPYQLIQAPCPPEGGGEWHVTAQSSARDGSLEQLSVVKRLHMGTAQDNSARIECQLEFQGNPHAWSGKKIGLETVINFLAPDSWDRALFALQEANGSRILEERLNWRGVVSQCPRLGFIDGWRGVEVQICFDQPVDWWVIPIYTVSRSEEGLEKIYQGSQVLAVLSAPGALSANSRIRTWLEIRKI